MLKDFCISELKRFIFVTGEEFGLALSHEATSHTSSSLVWRAILLQLHLGGKRNSLVGMMRFELFPNMFLGFYKCFMAALSYHGLESLIRNLMYGMLLWIKRWHSWLLISTMFCSGEKWFLICSREERKMCGILTSIGPAALPAELVDIQKTLPERGDGRTEITTKLQSTACPIGMSTVCWGLSRHLKSLERILILESPLPMLSLKTLPLYP